MTEEAEEGVPHLWPVTYKSYASSFIMSRMASVITLKGQPATVFLEFAGLGHLSLLAGVSGMRLAVYPALPFS